MKQFEVMVLMREIQTVKIETSYITADAKRLLHII